MALTYSQSCLFGNSFIHYLRKRLRPVPTKEKFVGVHCKLTFRTHCDRKFWFNTEKPSRISALFGRHRPPPQAIKNYMDAQDYSFTRDDLFYEQWKVPLRIGTPFLTDNWPHFASDLFHSVNRQWKNKHITSILNHSQSDGQAEWYDKIIAACLIQYTSEHQQNWNIFFQSLAYAHNRQVLWSRQWF